MKWQEYVEERGEKPKSKRRSFKDTKPDHKRQASTEDLNSQGMKRREVDIKESEEIDENI